MIMSRDSVFGLGNRVLRLWKAQDRGAAERKDLKSWNQNSTTFCSTILGNDGIRAQLMSSLQPYDVISESACLRNLALTRGSL